MVFNLLRRTGIFSEPTPEKCAHYARLLQPLSRQQTDAIFWALFTTVLVLLIVSSGMYTRASKTLSDPELALESKTKSLSTTHRRTRTFCLCVSILCFIIAIPCIAFEALAILHIQFCDGEDLTMLYWGFWTLLQCGSLVAILGVSLNQWYGLNGHSQPPWAVALGTPVLIVAAIAHAGQSVISGWRREHKERRRSASGRGRERAASATPSIMSGAGMSRATTIVTQAPPGSRFVGFTLDNEPLFAFPPDASLTPFNSSRRLSCVDPLMMSAVATPLQAHSPEREVKFASKF